jgi:hypothetical protein
MKKFQEIKNFSIENNISLIEAIEFYKYLELKKINKNIDIVSISENFTELKEELSMVLQDIAYKLDKIK